MPEVAAGSPPRRRHATPEKRQRPAARWRLQPLAGLPHPKLEASRGPVLLPSPDGPPHGKNRGQLNCDAQRGHRHRNARDRNRRDVPASQGAQTLHEWLARRRDPSGRRGDPSGRRGDHHCSGSGNPVIRVGPLIDPLHLWNLVARLARMACRSTSYRLWNLVARLARMAC